MKPDLEAWRSYQASPDFDGLEWPSEEFRRGADWIERLEAALAEIVKREARSEYSSIYAAPGEFAAIAREALQQP